MTVKTISKTRTVTSATMLALGLAILLPSVAQAACTSPAGAAGDIVYSSSANVMAYCNGTSWISMGQSSSVAFGTLTTGAFCTATSSTQISCTTTQINAATQITGVLPAANGGTGVANSSTITLGGNLTTSGAYTLTLTTTGNTNVTLPTSGTLIAGPASAAQGDILYYNGSAWTNLGAGTSGYVLQTQGTGANPTWAAPSIGTGAITGTVGTGQGGTGTSTTFTQGSVVFAGASGIYTQDNANFFYDATNHRLGIGTATPTANLTVNGTTVFTFGSDYTTIGSQSAVALGSTSAVRYAGTAAATFYGIAAGVNGQVIHLTNASSYTLTLSNQSTLEGTATNKIITGTAADLQMAAGSSVILQYDGTTARWRVVGGSGGGTPAGTTGQVQFNTAGAFNADAGLTWDNTNKYLGIGTDTPAYNIDAATGTVAGTVVHVKSAGTTVSTGVDLGGVAINTATLGQMAYFAGTNTISGTSQMYVGTNGIGIGTATPDVPLTISANTTGLQAPDTTATGTMLHVAGADNAKARILIDAYGSSVFPVLTFRRANGTATAPTTVQSGDLIGAINFGGYGGSAYVGSIVGIGANATENWTASANGALFYISTTPTGSTAAVTRVTVDGSGNVGIGTTAPIGSSLAGTDLHVYNSASTGTVASNATVIAQSVNRNAIFQGLIPTTGTASFQGYSPDYATSYGVININANSGSPFMSFATGNIERMRIDASGNVGIGTASPGYPLEVKATSSSGSVHVAQFSGDATYNLIDINNASSGSSFKNGIQFRKNGAGKWEMGNDFSSTGAQNFWIYDDISSAVRLFIDASGNVSIGTTSALGKMTLYWASASQQGLVIQTSSTTFTGSPIVFENSSGGISGYIGQAASTVSYNTSSDRRLKENIVLSQRGLDVLRQIGVQDFNFIADPKKEKVQGFIAQDLYKIYPEAVTVGGENAAKQPWAVDYGRLMPLVVKAVQELKTLFDKDHDVLEKLKADNDQLRADFEQYKKEHP